MMIFGHFDPKMMIFGHFDPKMMIFGHNFKKNIFTCFDPRSKNDPKTTIFGHFDPKMMIFGHFDPKMTIFGHFDSLLLHVHKSSRVIWGIFIIWMGNN